MLAKLGFGKKNNQPKAQAAAVSPKPGGGGGNLNGNGPQNFGTYSGQNGNFNGNGPNVYSQQPSNSSHSQTPNHRRKKKARQEGGAMTYNFDPQQKLSILGMENIIRRSWNVGSVVRVIHNNNFEIATILSVKGDVLHLLLDDGKTLKKTDRWSMEVQPMDTGDILGQNENKSGEFDSDDTNDDANSPNSGGGGISGIDDKKSKSKSKKKKKMLKSKSHKNFSDDENEDEGTEGEGTLTRSGTTTGGFYDTSGKRHKKKKKKRKKHKSKKSNKSKKSVTGGQYESKDDSKDDFKDDEKYSNLNYNSEDDDDDDGSYSYESDDSDFDESSLMYYGYNEDELLKAAIEASLNEVQRLCGYTIWVQWCDSKELHGYYHCSGFKHNKYSFTHKKDPKAELMADAQGFWYLQYDKKVLYKSSQTGEDPPPRQWVCIEGSLPPPGVSMVELPDQHSPMVVIDKKKLENARRNPTQVSINPALYGSGVNNNEHTASAMLSAANGDSNKKRKSKSNKKGKKDKKEKKDVLEELQDELHLPLQVMQFDFDGSKPVAFHLNVKQRMEVTKVKEDGQAAQLGVKQGDILIKINDEDISTDWDKATGMLRSCMMAKQMFSITFCRRMVEHLYIFVARAGIDECNGKYQFYKRDPADDDCPIFVKVRSNPALNEEIFDNNDDPLEDPLHDEVLTDESSHILQRVFSDPENNEALWVIKNGKDEHFYIAMTNEYLPPQQSWDLAPEGLGKYPAPGLKFHTKQTKFVTKMLPQEVEAERHDVLNVANRTRMNRHMHKKTLVKMQRAMSNMQEITAQRKNNPRAASGIVGAAGGGAYGAPGKIGGIGGVTTGGMGGGAGDSVDSSLFSPTGTDSRAEMMWQKKIEDVSKKAMDQLQSQHNEELSRKQSKFEAEISKKKTELTEAQTTIDDLAERLTDANEYYFDLWIDKCNMSLALYDTMEEVGKQKQKAKEIAKSYYQKIDETEELRAQIQELTESYSSRIVSLHNQNAVQANQLRLSNNASNRSNSGGNGKANKKSGKNNNNKKKKGKRGKKGEGSDSDSIEDEVDLADLEKQFLSLADVNPIMSVEDHDRQVELEDEVYDLKTQLDSANMKIKELTEESETWQEAHEEVWQTLQDRDKRLAELEGSEMYHKTRSMNFKERASNFERKIYDLMALLQSVENEYNQRLGNLPPSTKNIDWRKEYDPRTFVSSYEQSGVLTPTGSGLRLNNSDENYDASIMRHSGAMIDEKAIQSFSKKRSKRAQSKSQRASQLQNMPVEGNGVAAPAQQQQYQQQQQQYRPPSPNIGIQHKPRMSKIADL